MGKNAVQILFPKIRRNVLGAMLLHPRKTWYLSQLARYLRAAPSHLHRELAALVIAGILTRRVEGRQTYYRVNPACPFLPELTGLLRKLMGAPAVLETALRPLCSRIRCAFIYGSVAQGTEESGSDVDLLIVGNLGIGDLLPRLKQADRALGRSVNPTVYPPAELARKFKGGHHFIRSVLDDPAKIFIIGSARDLEAIANGTTDQTASDKSGRTKRPTRRRRSQAQ